MLESKTLRTGTLYYARFGGGSKLRINFDTLTQDDGPQQKYVEYYIFDGQWLTHIDYQIKQVQKRQLAEANEPIDAFELAKRNFPIIGFSKTDDLKKEFDVNLVGESNGLVHLHMKVKPDSIYKDDYKSVEVWIDTGKSDAACQDYRGFHRGRYLRDQVCRSRRSMRRLMKRSLSLQFPMASASRR